MSARNCTAIAALIALTACATTREPVECAERRADIAAADACRADARCAAHGWDFLHVDADRAWVREHCSSDDAPGLTK